MHHPILAADFNFAMVVFLVVSFISWILSLSKNQKKGQQRPPRPAQQVRPLPNRESVRPGRRPVQEQELSEEQHRRSSAQMFEESKRRNRESRERERSRYRQQDSTRQVVADPELQEMVRDHLQRANRPDPISMGKVEAAEDADAIVGTQPDTVTARQESSEGRAVNRTAVTPESIAAAIRNPQEVRKAIVMNEILTRPQYPRSRR